MSHTPLPWTIIDVRPPDDYGPGRQRVIGNGNEAVCKTSGFDAKGKDEANANLIVTAVNCHVDLLAVVKRIIANCEPGRPSRHEFADGSGSLAGCSMSQGDIQAARVAIAKVEGRLTPKESCHA